jgi:hypothetical protein
MPASASPTQAIVRVIVSPSDVIVGERGSGVQPPLGSPDPAPAIDAWPSDCAEDILVAMSFDGIREAHDAHRRTLPHAVNIQGSVAELWKAQNGKLQELTIFFDTGSFDRLAKG